jgi:hypothetical protein
MRLLARLPIDLDRQRPFTEAGAAEFNRIPCQNACASPMIGRTRRRPRPGMSLTPALPQPVRRASETERPREHGA